MKTNSRSGLDVLTDDLKLRTRVITVLKMISIHTKNSNIRVQMFKVLAASQIMEVVSLLFRDKQIAKFMRLRLLYME